MKTRVSKLCETTWRPPPPSQHVLGPHRLAIGPVVEEKDADEELDAGADGERQDDEHDGDDQLQPPPPPGVVRLQHERHRAGGSFTTSTRAQIGRTRMTTGHLQGECAYIRAEVCRRRSLSVGRALVLETPPAGLILTSSHSVSGMCRPAAQGQPGHCTPCHIMSINRRARVHIACRLRGGQYWAGHAVTGSSACFTHRRSPRNSGPGIYNTTPLQVHP